MSKLLAVSWNTHTLRYVLAETQKRGAVRVLEAGEKPFGGTQEDNATGAESADVVQRLREIVSDLKASRAKLILCVGRGSVDSTRFTVPPATAEELPTLVRNMALRQLTGLAEDAAIDYVSFPPLDDGSCQVSAMAVAAADEQLIHRMVKASGCTRASAVVVTHPLRTFVPLQDETDRSATLVISKGSESAHILVVQHQRPVLSRTLRLAVGASRETEAQFISLEIQRTILTVRDQLERGVEISNAILVGSELETEALAGSLEGRIDAKVTRSSAADLIDGEAGEAAQGAFAPLIAALLESAAAVTPAVDFLNPRRPPTSTGQRQRLMAAAAVLLLTIGAGWYYTNSLFAEWNDRIAELAPQLESMTENVGKTAPMRRLAAGLTRWERSRMNWLDEIRDITIRMPSSSEVSVRQFAATPAGSGFTVTFQGTSRSPEAHRAMEVGIQDRYHTTRTPSFSESRKGKEVVWNFRTTLQIRQRANKDYTAHKNPDVLQPAPDAPRPDMPQATTSQPAANRSSTVVANPTEDDADTELEAPQS
ncbi:MAG: hypothetical protein ABGZ35_16870 [Planctomycetaceae bacterium]